VKPINDKNPHVKPSGTSHQALNDYIVQHVAGPGY
jgi:hypothetical protein